MVVEIRHNNGNIIGQLHDMPPAEASCDVLRRVLGDGCLGSSTDARPRRSRFPRLGGQAMLALERQLRSRRAERV
jgi:hypothetical protein